MRKGLLVLPVMLLLFACGGEQQEVIDTKSKVQANQAPRELSTDRVFFAFDSSALSAKSKMILEAAAEWLESDETITIVIEGYCDERGTREYNLALGERRAGAAKKYLVSLGIAPSRIRTISYGKERASKGKSEAVWSKDRRAVIVRRG